MTADEVQAAVRTGCAQMGVALGEDADRAEQALQRIGRFHALLVEANAHVNLTRDADAPDAAARLYLDALTPLAQPGLVPEDAQALRAVDVGSGAGFPGIPLAIARPALRFTLVDSLSKRVDFCNTAIAALGLANVRAVHARAEDFAKVMRGRFDLAFSRAVAALPVLLELALPLLKPGGLFIAHKGPAVRSEWASARVAAGLLGARLQDLIPTDIPGQAWAHVLVVARQTVSAPAQYPRKAGEPERHPLGLLQTNEGGAL